MNGGHRVAEILKRQGVQNLYTLCGGHISPILVEAKRLGIRVIDTRDEKNAVFAADAQARLSGIPGVAAVTAGPGVTNSLTAVKNAQLAQSPLILLGGATATMLRGRGSLQDIDQVALMQPHVKWIGRPNTLREVVPAVEKAFEIAMTGVPGPVFVELAVDLLYPENVIRDWYKAKTDKPDKNPIEHATSLYIKGHLAYLFSEIGDPTIHDRIEVPFTDAGRTELWRAVRMLRGAERPLLVLGSQVMLHPTRIDRLISAIERIGVPVYLSGMARGLLPPGHRLLFRHQRRQALKGADVVVLAGVPADFRLDYGAHVSRAEVIGVNLSREDLFKNRKPELPVLADPCHVLIELGDRLSSAPGREPWFSALRQREAEREVEIDKMAAEKIEPLNPIAFCRAIDRHLSEDAILIGDGGDFVATASYTLGPRRPLSWLDPGVFGTLGVGAGFALAAKVQRPRSDVWILYGDGAAGFSLIEMDSFVRHQVPVIAVIGNDAGWTQIQRDQVPVLGDDVGTCLTHAAYHEIARGCGAHGILLDDPAKTDAALDEAVRVSREGKPVVINAIIGKSEFRKGSISI